MKLLVLYEELAAYFIACVSRLAIKHEVEIHIIRKNINPDAPFEFKISDQIKIYDRDKYNERQLQALINAIKPDAILCGGWSYAPYLAVCKKYNDAIPVILGFDNWWTGTLKQYAASIFGRSFFKKHFQYCFVPGRHQRWFAKKMGFNENKIMDGAYSCDQNYFQSLYLRTKDEKTNKFPHRFIFVGRYYEFKGVNELWKAFSELKAETKNDWELWCLGKGDIKPVEYPSIKHFGFVQPNEMEKFMKETGVFILPSRFEPWGVALHEFAAAGFPLLCSDEVGASEVFLEKGRNGISFCANNKNDLRSKLEQIISLSDKELNEMGSRSNELSKKITTDTWSDSVFKMMNEK